MSNNEIIKRLKKIGFTKGRTSRHSTMWNCPCSEKNHVVGVGNHPSDECWFLPQVHKRLGPHIGEFNQKKK